MLFICVPGFCGSTNVREEILNRIIFLYFTTKELVSVKSSANIICRRFGFSAKKMRKK